MDEHVAPTPMPAPPAPAPAPPPPAALASGSMEGPAPTAPMPETRSVSPWRWLVLGLGLIAITIAAFALVLYRQEANAHDDAERALTETRTALADAENRSDDAEARATEADSALAETKAALDESEARATEAGASLADYEDGLIDLLALYPIGNLGLSGSDTDCIADALVVELGPDAIDFANFGFTIESNDRVRAAAETCEVDPATFESLLPQEGFGYGDNPVLDALYDQCAAGDGAACDSLFVQSQVGTDYETFGYTCGGTVAEADAIGFCEGSG